MSRYYPISNSGVKSIITPGGYGEGQPITFTKKPKTQKSTIVSGGSDGPSGPNVSVKTVGEY